MNRKEYMKKYKQEHRLNYNARGVNLLKRGSGTKYVQNRIQYGTNGGINYGYQLLITQIIIRACDDYIQQKLKKTRDSKVKEKKLEEVTSFFVSEFFTDMTGIDGDDFIKILDKKIETSLQHNKPVL